MLVTFPDDLVAKKIIDEVLEHKLAGCILRSSVKSAYVWDGQKQGDDEIVTLFKTTEEKSPDLEKFILANHPYETPAILTMNATANSKYEQWLRTTLS